MPSAHTRHWPRHAARHLTVPATNVFYNVEVSARRFPDKPCLLYYGARISYSRLRHEAEALAGWMEAHGVRRGDRVLLVMQNCPQFVIGYYAILRANAVVVPVNPMNLTAELRHCVADSGARMALVAQEILPRMGPLLGHGLDRLLVAAYADYLDPSGDSDVPAFVREPIARATDERVTRWGDAVAMALRPGALVAGPDDLCALPYTSGTTGRPKGCMHTHRGAMHTLVASMQWFGLQQDAVFLSVMPFFHVSGMQGSMNGPLFAGATVAILPRWNPDTAAALIERHGVTSWTAAPTMVIDFFNNPGLARYDLSSLSYLCAGGAAMPDAVARRIADRGMSYVEGYGLSETIAPTHINPPDRPKNQCIGIPIFDTEATIVDPSSLEEVEQGRSGEILVSGPQVFRGYWNDPEATSKVLVQRDGRNWLRTGDVGYVDEDGYFFVTDRLKRLINAAGFKVSPAEVEALLYGHPAVAEACVIGTADVRRGETVKAVIVLKQDWQIRVSEQDIVEWCRTVMAAYKVPRVVKFVESLPKSATGKVQWRRLQEMESALHADRSPRTASPP